MSRSAEVTLAFGGEDRIFRLPLGRLRALQEKTDAGPMELLQRYAASNWRIDDVREAILQGLIGGGTDQHSATKLMQSYFDDTPVFPHVALAQSIVAASIIGVEDESLGEPQAGAPQKKRSRATKSASPASTEPAPSSATPRAK